MTIEFPCELNGAQSFTLAVVSLVNQDYFIGDPIQTIDLTSVITADPDESISGSCWSFSFTLLAQHPLPVDDPTAIVLDQASKEVSIFTEKESSAGAYHLRYSAFAAGTGVELAHH